MADEILNLMKLARWKPGGTCFYPAKRKPRYQSWYLQGLTNGFRAHIGIRSGYWSLRPIFQWSITVPGQPVLTSKGGFLHPTTAALACEDVLPQVLSNATVELIALQHRIIVRGFKSLEAADGR